MITVRRYDGRRDFDNVSKLATEFSEDDLREALAYGLTWTVEYDNEFAGHLISTIKGVPYVWNVSIVPAFRRRGLATRLMNEFEREYLSPVFWLHVRTDNPAQKLYFDLGYRVTNIAKDFYGEQQDGLVMVKRLI